MRHEIIAAGRKSIPAQICSDNIDPFRCIHGSLDQARFTDVRSVQIRPQRIRIVIHIRHTNLQQMRQAVLLADLLPPAICITAAKIGRSLQRFLTECSQYSDKIRCSVYAFQSIYIW